MTKRLVIGLFSFVILTLSSAVASAEIRFEPDPLSCPTTRQGRSVDCGNFILKNKNLLLSIKVQDVKIGDTTNFTLNASGCAGKTLAAGQSCPVTVTFKAFEGGGFYTSAIASYTYVGFSKVNKISAMVYGLATYPIARLSTNKVDFGHQTIGTSQRQYIKLENVGTATMGISSISVPIGSAFSSEDDCGTSLAAGNYCGILVYFEPTAEEEYVATLEIVDDSYNSPQQVRLSGLGISPGEADINIDKKYINFGDLEIGGESEEEITLTSAGTIALDITSITASGIPFTLTGNCVKNLDPEESCAITVTFSPTQTGAYSGTITIDDNATDTPQTIYLSGKGVSPNATLTPSLVDFGHQTIGKSSLSHEMILLNSGTSTLEITEISTSSALYSQTNTCGTSLAPKKICKILVTFSPTETGIFPATLTVTSNDPGGESKAFLFGRGITGPDLDISPPMFDFGSNPVGSTSEQKDFTLKNTGEGDLNISSITVNSDFDQDNECPEVLVEEQSCVVETTFTPMAAGSFFGILSILDDAEGSPHKANLMGYGTTFDITIIPASVNFGHQTVGKSSLSQSIQLLNSGNESIDIESIESSSSVFTQTNDCGDSLAPAAFCTISATFTPDTTDYVTGEIVINDSASGSPHSIALTGTGIDPEYPDLDIAPSSWDFGQILVGQESAVKEFTLKNTGVVDATIYGIDANSEFVETNDCPETLAADESCTISAKFAPEAAGQFMGYITVIDDTYSRYQYATLQGKASHSGDIDISFSTSSIDFGSIPPMTESDVQSIILTNAGTDDATIGAVTIVGSETTDFSMYTNCSGRSLDVGKSCIINVTFRPTSTGLKTADVVVYDDAHDSPQPIFLSGTGASGSGCTLSQHKSVDFTMILGTAIAAAALAMLALRRRFTN